MKKIPLYSKDLIKELDEQYPEKCPELFDTDRIIWVKLGERRVVRHLLARLKNQEKDILDVDSELEN